MGILLIVDLAVAVLFKTKHFGTGRFFGVKLACCLDIVNDGAGLP